MLDGEEDEGNGVPRYDARSGAFMDRRDNA